MMTQLFKASCDFDKNDRIEVLNAGINGVEVNIKERFCEEPSAVYLNPTKARELAKALTDWADTQEQSR